MFLLLQKYKTVANRIFKFLLFLLILSTANVAAKANLIPSGTDSLPDQEEQKRLEKIEKRLTKSPHYKNRNAAGRVAVLNRNAPAATNSVKKTLIGPKYKNRKFSPDPAKNSGKPASSKLKLMGPRYKNKGAKAH